LRAAKPFDAVEAGFEYGEAINRSLKVDDVPEVMYHVAPRSVRESIESSGLTPQGTWNTGVGRWPGMAYADDAVRTADTLEPSIYRPDGVYMFENLKDAQGFMSGRVPMDIYEVRTGDIARDGGQIIRDPESVGRFAASENTFVTRIAPSDYISRIGGGRAADVARAVEPRVTLRADQVERVQGMGNEHWFRVPDPNNANASMTLPGTSGGGRLGGRPMRIEEVPEELYHVTTAAPALRESGVIQVSGGLNRGAGGYSGSGSVSTTASKEIAETLQNDLRVFAQIKNFQTREEVVSFFKRLFREGNFNAERMKYIDDAISNRASSSPGDLGKYLFNEWTSSREFFGGPRSSLVIGDPMSDYWRTVSPENIEIFTIPKSSIPEGALINDYDLGRRGLEEIQIYADVPLK
jgi:hypothetical protein